MRFAIRQGLQPADAEDVAQAVFGSLFRSMPGFHMAPEKGRFRSYLFRVMRNEISRFRSRDSRPASNGSALFLEADVESDATRPSGVGHAADPIEQSFEEEWLDHHLRLAMTEVRRSFSHESVSIFERLLRGETVESVAASCATTVDAVHKVKQRVRDRIKALIEAQIAEED